MSLDSSLAFRDPILLWGLALVPLLWWLRYRGRAVFPIARLPFSLPDPSTRWPRTWRSRCRALPDVMALLAMSILVVALAGPELRRIERLTTSGIDLVIALDRSSSMDEREGPDAPRRWDVARQAALRFIDAREGDRIGVLAFARYPDLLCPPTFDHAALQRLLEPVQPVMQDGEEDATGIGAALTAAARMLATSTAASKVVVLLSDGEENLAHEFLPREISPRQAGQLCEDMGLRVHVVAAGPPRTAASPPKHDLALLARRTGGRHFRAQSPAALDAVWSEIDALESSAFDSFRIRVEERQALFLIVGALAWGLAALLRATLFEEAGA